MIPSCLQPCFPGTPKSAAKFSNQSCLLPCAPPAGPRLTEPRCSQRWVSKFYPLSLLLLVPALPGGLPTPACNSSTHFSNPGTPLSLNAQSIDCLWHLRQHVIADPLCALSLFLSIYYLWPVHKFLQVSDQDSDFFWTPEHSAQNQANCGGLTIRHKCLVSLETISNWE